jgi:hypothetical protein
VLSPVKKALERKRKQDGPDVLRLAIKTEDTTSVRSLLSHMKMQDTSKSFCHILQQAKVKKSPFIVNLTKELRSADALCDKLGSQFDAESYAQILKIGAVAHVALKTQTAYYMEQSETKLPYSLLINKDASITLHKTLLGEGTFARVYEVKQHMLLHDEAREKLEKKGKLRTAEENFDYLIHCLTHSDPSKRMTVKQFRSALKSCQQKAFSLHLPE